MNMLRALIERSLDQIPSGRILQRIRRRERFLEEGETPKRKTPATAGGLRRPA
jgi:hypothetical protein